MNSTCQLNGADWGASDGIASQQDPERGQASTKPAVDSYADDSLRLVDVNSISQVSIAAGVARIRDSHAGGQRVNL
ncbi:MAG: hypothetical protein M3O70_07305, partial [Actinomycetota bacterium]|nr:hypothetical protein [Actinomycetota bacterium]